MTPAPDEPRVALSIRTISHLADGPLHRTDEIRSSACILFWLIDGEDGAPVGTKVGSEMMANGPQLRRLAMAALDVFDQQIGLENLLAARQPGSTVVLEHQRVVDQPPLRPHRGSRGHSE